MSHTISATGKPFGLQRGMPGARLAALHDLCRARQGAQQGHPTCAPVDVAQSPRWPDHERLAAVRADLTRTPFVGEGARKVWARLRIQDDIRVSRASVARLIRENGLLSPHRRPQKPPNAHDGRMTTDRPNEMWGTGGTKVQTVDEGLVWIFAAVDHCDAACVGIHVTKVGDRFAALEPISQGVREQFGSVEADAGRGLSL
ncbi:MAG: transposase [Burkholderia sp.]